MKFEVNNKLDLDSVPDFFISVAILIDKKGNPSHAGILIKFDNKLYLCHYIDLNDKPILELYNDDKYYFNIINSLDIREEEEVRYFYEWLRKVCAQSKMSYGYQLENNTYSFDGLFNGENGEIGTCVSFCLYLLNYLVIDGDEYFLNIDDWDDSSLKEETDERFRNMLKMLNKNFNEEEYLKNRKRIKPLELFTGSFQDNTPVRKRFVDKHISIVSNELQKLKLE